MRRLAVLLLLVLACGPARRTAVRHSSEPSEPVSCSDRCFEENRACRAAIVDDNGRRKGWLVAAAVMGADTSSSSSRVGEIRRDGLAECNSEGQWCLAKCEYP